MKMKDIFGVVLVLLGIAITIWIFVSGVMDVVFAISPFQAMKMVVGIVKVVFCGLGTIISLIGFTILER